MAIVSSVLIMLYLIAFQPMTDDFSNTIVIIHELAIYFCSLLTLIFTNVVPQISIRFQVANVWVGIIILILGIDSISLASALVMKSKKTLELFAINYRH